MDFVVQWLEGLGLGQYRAAFVEADIDLSVLRDLSEADLEKLGVTLGHRKKLLRAIAGLSAGAGVAPTVGVSAVPPPGVGEAERRLELTRFRGHLST